MVGKSIYFGVGAISLIIFIAGIFAGFSLTTWRTNSFENQLKVSNLDISSFELETSILSQIDDELVCRYIEERLPELIDNKIKLANKFDDANIQESEFKLLKKEYTIALMRYWLFSRIEDKKCGTEMPNILFFFSLDQEESRQQGKVLDYWVYKSGNNISVFPFNVGLNESSVSLMVDVFNITQTPSIVINDTKYGGLIKTDKLKEIICESYNISICSN